MTKSKITMNVEQSQRARDYIDTLDNKYGYAVDCMHSSSVANFGINDFTSQALRVSKEEVEKGVKIIREELNELLDAVEAGDKTEIIDGAVDLNVTMYNLFAKLITLGYDLGGAIAATDLNNLSKFTSDYEVAIASQKKYADEGVNVSIIEHPPTMRYILLDDNSKYRKPIDFVPNDLTKFTVDAADMV